MTVYELQLSTDLGKIMLVISGITDMIRTFCFCSMKMSTRLFIFICIVLIIYSFTIILLKFKECRIVVLFIPRFFFVTMADNCGT